jgi:hypothetical protein
MKVGANLKCPKLPIWIICSESHYSILFSTELNLAKGLTTTFDVVYYDELARQEEDIILTVSTTKAMDKNKHTIPIDATIRTKWGGANINWNGRT